MKMIAILLGLLFLAAPAQAFDKLFGLYSKKSGVPRELSIAIAKQESGLNPLCINVAGVDMTPATMEEAEAIIRQAQAQDKSYDVGLMQINSQWVKEWKIDPVSLLDPETNIRLGVKILRDEIDRHGMNWLAVGKYHSPDPLRGRQYACMVSKYIKGNPELRGKIASPGDCVASGFSHGESALVRSMLANPRLRSSFGKGAKKSAIMRSILSNPRLGLKGKKHSIRLGALNAIQTDISGANSARQVKINFSRRNSGFDGNNGWKPGSVPRYGYGQ